MATNKPSRPSTFNAASVAASYAGSTESKIYNSGSSIFNSHCERLAFFSMVRVRMDVSQGSKACGESITIKLNRLGHLMMQMVLCVRVAGICSYSAAPYASAPHSNGWLTPHATLQIEPYLVDYIALALMTKATFCAGNADIQSLSNDACLDIEELLAVGSKSAAMMMGKHSAMSANPWDAAKFDTLYMVPLCFFFCAMSGFALPSSVIGYHTAEVKVVLGAFADVVVIPDVLESSLGGSSSLALFRAGGFELFVRPPASPWGGLVPATPLTADSLIQDIYLRVNVIYVSKSEVASILSKESTFPFLKCVTQRDRAAFVVAPSDIIENYSIKLTSRKPIAFLTCKARQAGVEFARLHSGFRAEAVTQTITSILRWSLEMDDEALFDEYADESAINQYWFAGSQTSSDILFYSFAMSAVESCPNGNLPASRSTDLYLKVDIAAEVYAAGVQVLEVTTNVYYWALATYNKGMLKVKGA